MVFLHHITDAIILGLCCILWEAAEFLFLQRPALGLSFVQKNVNVNKPFTMIGSVCRYHTEKTLALV